MSMANYLHSRSLPILRSAEEPEKKNRNLCSAYFIVFLSNVIIGVFGYVTFIGVDFYYWYYLFPDDTFTNEIATNCLNMFPYWEVVSFVVRICAFFELFATYPIVNIFSRTYLLNIFFPKSTVDKCDLIVLNIIVTAIPLVFACLYPNIGTLLMYTGAFAGSICMYFLPVFVHLKRRYTQITNPLLAEALSLNEFTILRKLSDEDPRFSYPID